MAKKNNWYKLDNAAKIYPPSSTKKDSKIFRFSCDLINDVNEKSLQYALNKTIEEYQIYNSVIGKGIFWHYLEYSNEIPVVTKEDTLPITRLKTELLFDVTYYKKRINLEVSHALSDGTGALEFMKSLVNNYICYEHDIKDQEIINTSSSIEKESDSFRKYYKPSKKIVKTKNKKAYQLKGKIYPENRIKIIEAQLPLDKIKELAKKNNTTLTIYLIAILIKSISMTKDKRNNLPIIINVPVDLRKHFKSKSVRNFFNVISIRYEGKYELDDIIESTTKQINKYLTKEELGNTLNKLSLLENIFIIRLVPLFIKNVVMKYFYNYLKKYHTTTISNLGLVILPNNIKPYIKAFSAYSSTAKMHTCVCTLDNTMSISFTSHFISPEIQKNFIRILSDNNINISINTNNIEEGDAYE